MLDKAPWILAFDISKALVKTKQDLEVSEALHQLVCMYVCVDVNSNR